MISLTSTKSSFQTRDGWIGALLASVAFCLDLPFLSKGYVVEGLYRAMPIETDHLNHLFAGNYLLYGPLGFLFHSLLGYFGIHPLAVISLQVMDCFLGSAGVMVYYFILRNLEASEKQAIGWSLVLATSLGYWLWSTEAEDYIFSTLLLQINFLALVRQIRKGEIRPVKLGLLHSLAMMGHVVNLLYGAVVLWGIYRTDSFHWKKHFAIYLATTVATVLLIYTLVLVFVKDFADPVTAILWFSGSATTHGGMRLGGLPGLEKLSQWIQMTSQIFFSFSPYPLSPSIRLVSGVFLWMGKGILAALLLMGLRMSKALFKEQPIIPGACLIWIGAYALMFMRWEPWTMVYRVSDLIPLCTLLYLVSRQWQRHWGPAAWAGGLLAVCLGIGNLNAEIIPLSLAANNHELQRILFIRNQTQEMDWVMGVEGIEEIYLPYFAQRRPIVVDRYALHPEALQNDLDKHLARGERIYATSRLQNDPTWIKVSDHYCLQEKAIDVSGDALFLITSCSSPHPPAKTP